MTWEYGLAMVAAVRTLPARPTSLMVAGRSTCRCPTAWWWAVSPIPVPAPKTAALAFASTASAATSCAILRCRKTSARHATSPAWRAAAFWPHPAPTPAASARSSRAPAVVATVPATARVPAGGGGREPRAGWRAAPAPTSPMLLLATARAPAFRQPLRQTAIPTSAPAPSLAPPAARSRAVARVAWCARARAVAGLPTGNRAPRMANVNRTCALKGCAAKAPATACAGRATSPASSGAA